MSVVRKRLLGWRQMLVCCAIGALLAPVAVARHDISAESVIFSNSTTVKRYYGKNVHGRVLPASTVKVMTALLVLEKLSLDDVVTTSHRATLPQPTKINLRVGEQFYVRDLLAAILIKSANDASVALAEAVAGSEPEFVRLMNQRARQLGAKNTRFANSNGLPTPKQAQYSTAYDMYLIFRQAVKHSFFRETLKKRYQTITSRGGRRIALKSHNRILFQDWNRPVWGKTGWTRSARQCFVGYIPRNNEICIIALFGASTRWQDIKHIVAKYGGFIL